MDMKEFAAAKRAMLDKWGDKLIYGTAAEMLVITREAAPLAKFARLRPAKFVWALGQDWLARQRGAV